VKNYVAPELEIVVLNVENVITSSDNEIDLSGSGSDFWV